MKKSYLLIVLSIFIFINKNVYAQCTPDPYINTLGSYLYPEVLPFANPDVPYSQVLTFRVPLDTQMVYGGFLVDAHVDSAQCIFIKGIPKGYSKQCNNPLCIWQGGSLGCARLYGIGDSTMLGTYPMMVYVYTWVRLGKNPPYTNITRIDSSEYTFKIVLPSGLFEVEPLRHLKAYPNPVNDILNIELTDIKTANNNLIVFDQTGRKVFEKNFGRPDSYYTAEQLDLSVYSKGLYTVVLKTDDKVTMKKVLKD